MCGNLRPDDRRHLAQVLALDQIVSGRYRVVRFLNRGGMGEVYEAEDLELREHVALKTLLPNIAGDDRSIARFKKEIQLARKVAHPNVCRVFDLARHPTDNSSPGGIYYLTMELLAGETLEARLRRAGPMKPAEALPVLESTAAALDAAHRAGIVHRDLKPSNIMLTSTSGGTRIVVTDFGLARDNAPLDTHATTRTFTEHIMGTPGYMAPELLSRANASVPSDIYALGVTAYRMIAGAVPTGPEVSLPGVDPNWTQAIRRALDQNPTRRFGSAGEFVAALSGPGIEPRVAFYRTPLIAIAAILLLAVAWFGWKEWERWRAEPTTEALELYRTGTDNLHAASYFAAAKALEQATHLAPRFSLAHARLADAWMELEVPEKAGVEMLIARRGGTAGLSTLDRLQIDAIDLAITRDFLAAADKYRQMLKMAGAGKAEVYLDLARTYEHAEEIPKALENYEAASKAAPRNPAAWLRLAALHGRAAQQRARALEEFRTAEELYRVTSNLEGLTEVAYDRSVDAGRRGDVDENAAQARKALETARVVGNVHQEIRARLQLGSAAFFAGDPALAEEYAREAIDTARANRIDSLAIRGILVLGNACRRARDFVAAEKYYNEALAAARRDKTRWLASQSLLSLAGLHDRLKRSDEALREAPRSSRLLPAQPLRPRIGAMPDDHRKSTARPRRSGGSQDFP
jgi:tetratricopeptide (TPR) repeat protein